MTHIGIDIEQFVTDPYGSGIQRVLQYLAREWPADLATAEFVIPHQDNFLLLTPPQAAELIGLAFAPREHDDLRLVITSRVEQLAHRSPRVHQGALLSMFDAWLLPEVSYLPSVLDRFSLFNEAMPTAMIGYDALPMTEPGNYRFTPGKSGDVSRYFRMLATTDAVVCISEYSRMSILDRLRRSRTRATTVAHPGGDHTPIAIDADRSDKTPLQFLRIGTMEARKMPVELVGAFRQARQAGIEAELTFIGNASASDHAINEAVSSAVSEGIGVHWIQRASDEEIGAHIARSDIFLSVGTEGYGIPVLEAIRAGTPVVFAGTQPAAELMRGAGAFDVGGTTQAHLIEMFTRFSDPMQVRQLRDELNPEAVPPWSAFAQAVGQALVDVRQGL